MNFNNIPPSPPRNLNPTLPEGESTPKRQRTTREDPSLTEKTTSVATTLFDDQQTSTSSSSSIQINTIAEPQSPLAQAVSNEQWSEVQALIEANEIISVNETIVFKGHKINILQAIIVYKKFDLVQMMLDKDPNLDLNATVNEGRMRGTTPLWLAAYYQQWALVRSMLEKPSKADINATSAEGLMRGTTPLWWAAYYRHWNAVRLMLEKHPEPDINATHAEGSMRGITPLWRAAYYGQWKLVQLMLEKHPQPDINATSTKGKEHGTTPLWWAAYSNQWKLVQLMLEKHPEPNINAASSEGEFPGITPLLWATRFGHWDSARLMLEKHPKPDVNAVLIGREDPGITPLWCAAYNKQWDLVWLMLKKHLKPDINAAAAADEECGTTPLWWAAYYQQWNVVQLMLENHPKPDINATRVEGEGHGTTPLSLAAHFKQWDLVRIMLEKHLGLIGDNGLTQDSLKKVFAQILASAKRPIRTTLIYYCLLLEVDTSKFPETYLENILELRSALTKGLTAVTEILLTDWNYDGNGLYSLPTELRMKISQMAVYSAIPELRNLSQKKLLSIVTKQALNSSRLLPEKFLRKMSLLAFRQFRWNNNPLMSLKPMQVKDARACIRNTLENYPIDSLRDRHQQIINEIGKNIYPNPLNQTVIDEAVRRALA